MRQNFVRPVATFLIAGTFALASVPAHAANLSDGTSTDKVTLSWMVKKRAKLTTQQAVLVADLTITNRAVAAAKTQLMLPLPWIARRFWEDSLRGNTKRANDLATRFSNSRADVKVLNADISKRRNACAAKTVNAALCK